MSSDEVFAAQMWTWPGPMLKRDPSGRVTVVNAAFLQMYGGSVDAWTGNVVTGWPAPQPPGTTSRFEARMPQADGQEAVYDWIEISQNDGSCLAIARDVTQFMTVAPQLIPTAPVETQTDISAPAQNSGYPPPSAPPSEVGERAAAESLPPMAQQTPPEAQTSDTDPNAQTQTAQTPSQAAPVQAPVVQEEPPKRDFERRALPIENGESVLGNNWRDAVIAKAVGVEDTPEAQSGESETDTAQSDSGEGSKDSEGTRILLAEDNAINALLTRTLLEAEGCSVEVVEDGALAVEAMRNATYDMIFMDMRMPNMDGLEATRKIRAMDHRSKGLPIVALTANAFDDDRNACFDSGMNDFMTKPVSAEELSEMVKNHTGKVEERLAS